MTSDSPVLSIRSERDVQITIYDASGLKQLMGVEQVAATMPRGLYRVHLDRCGFVGQHLIRHGGSEDRILDGPLLESPAPIEIARASRVHAQLAQQLSGNHQASHLSLGGGAHDARMFVFVRRVNRGARVATVPSEPISIHDATGRRLVALTTDNSDHSSEPDVAYLALSCRVDSGTYRLRVGRTRRDLAITIPAGRAAQVFLADHGFISLRSARVYLPRVDDSFDPRGDIPRAMESVLWALGQPGEVLPPIARQLLSAVDRDLSFGIACAHLARRQPEPAIFDEIMRALTEQAPELPDVVMLVHMLGRQRRMAPASAGLATPPLFRASLALMFAQDVRVASHGALIHAAKARHDDSVWCTWSPRWWDERWIEPTVDRLRGDRGRSPTLVADIARSTWLPIEIVDGALDRLDAGLPRADGQPVPIGRFSVPGYTLGTATRGNHVTVFHARRDEDGQEVALKIMPVASREVHVRIAHEIQIAQRLGHKRLVRFERCGVLPGDRGLWLEMELCGESLFDRLAALDRPMPFDEACQVVLQALEALAYLHSQDVVHGNINPGSLLVRTDGSVVLGPPGLAANEDHGEPAAGMVKHGDGVHFRAPESVSNPAAITPASDVWSTAATLYFLLTLELPRERYADQSELDAARDNPVIPIADRMTGLPGLLTACIERALSPQPELRFRDGEAFHDALSQAVRAIRFAAQATELYDALVYEDAAYAATIRDTFIRMCLLIDGEIARRRVPRDEFATSDPAENRRVDVVLQQFHDAGLVGLGVEEKTDDGGTIAFAEPAHDELVRGWTQIRRWLDVLDMVPGTRTLLIAIGEAARSWRAHARTGTLLWRDRRVVLADAIQRDRRFRYSALEEEFVWRSSRRRSIRHVGWSCAMTAALAVISGCVYWQHERVSDSAALAETARAEVKTIRAETQTLARALQETGRQRVLDGHPLQALPYLVDAAKVGGVESPLRMLFRAASRRISHTPLLEHQGSVTQVAFSPDAKHVVTSSLDRMVRIWNAETGVLEHQLEHRAVVLGAAFSPDGKWVVTASEDRTARIWDVVTAGPRSSSSSGHDVVFEHDDFVQSAVFSSDAKRVLTASLDHTARIWNAETGAPEHRLEHKDAVWSAVFSPDGTRVVTASRDHTARIWDTRTGVEVGAPLEHQADVWRAAFNADGTLVVTASQDKTARIWDAVTGKPLAPPLVHRDGVTSAAFGPRGTEVVTTSYDGTARVWDAVTGTPITPWLDHLSSVTSAVFSPDGSLVVTASTDRMARIWDAKTGRLLAPVLEHTGPVTSAVFDATGTRVVTASFDRTARIWDISTDRSPAPFALGFLVRHAAFSNDDTRIVTAGDDNTARIWNTATGKLAGPALVHPAAIRTVAWSKDGSRVVTTSDEPAARIWDATTGRLLLGPLALPSIATSAIFSPDGSRVITASGSDTSRWDDPLRVWDARSGTRIPLLLAHPDTIVRAWLSNNGKRLVTLNQSQKAQVWDAVTGATITPALDQRGVTSVALSPDGTRVATAGEDGIVRVWNTDTGKPVGLPLEHDESVVCVSFSPDGARIATGSEGRIVRVWDAVTGKPLTAPLLHDAPIVNAAFSADGEHVLTVTSDAVRSWDVSLDSQSLDEWSKIAAKSPYILQDGVLVLRSVALGADIAESR